LDATGKGCVLLHQNLNDFKEISNLYGVEERWRKSLKGYPKKKRATGCPVSLSIFGTPERMNLSSIKS
jgi:hypothetical protein